MESQLLSLSKIFTERIFRIPDYQRGYAWTEKHVKDFWNDLIQLPSNRNHYVGVVTLEEVPHEEYSKWSDDYWIIDSKSFNPYFVVDGQQRLTTSIILIQAILDSISDDIKLNYTSKAEIKKKFIYDSKDEGISKSYLFGYHKDNPSYEYLKVKILNENSEENFTLQETSYTFNLVNAKEYFAKQLSELAITEKENIYKKLTQNFLFNIYSISADIDVYVAFETMNNRGKLLSYLELLKNRLIYLSTLFDKVEYEKEKLRKNINECWKDIYKYLGKNKEKPLDDDEFLSNHFMIYFSDELSNKMSKGTIYNINLRYSYRRIKSNNYQEYLLDSKFVKRNIISDEDKTDREIVSIPYINNYVKSLKDSVKFWYYLYNPTDSDFNDQIKDYLLKLNRTGIERDASLIMVFLQMERDRRVILDFLQAFERYKFLTLLCLRSDLYKIDLFNSIEEARKLFNKELTTKDITKKINDNVNKILGINELLDRIKDRFNKDGFYDWVGIKYFLFEYELSLKNQSKSDRVKIVWDEHFSNDFSTIEHIYPQKPRSDYWRKRFGHFTRKEKLALKNSLGNLVPISRSKNSSLQNKPFPEKIGNNKSMVGFKYGSYSENELTNWDDWTPNVILERGLSLLKFLEKRWNLKLGLDTQDKKIGFLGLEFLNKY